ncbi:MAG: trypsin-like peptidase domain-containing protein [Planctomycetes bacterium]|nr:trypsin-like peptidase domain-containing protein [Planctomycetota bacterium]
MRKSILMAGLCLAAMLFLSGNIYPQASKPPASGGDQPITKNTFIQIAQKVTPAVVNVWNMQEGGIFGGQVKSGGGTGFIIDAKKGVLLTNHHVVANAKALVITLNDKRTLKAKLIGSDPIYDVAVVQIESPPADLKQVTLGNSDKVMPGEWIIAIGQPLFMDYTVTAGIVCALGRETQLGKAQLSTIEYVGSYIMIDAIINPGNSGGPLFNANGEVVGINTIKLYAGYGYSIPINRALDTKDKIMTNKDGKVIRAYLGLRGRDIDDYLAMEYNTNMDDLIKDLGLKEPKGVFIQGAADNSPAASVGFEESDIMVEFDGKKVDNLKDFRAIIEKLKPEQEVKLKYLHKKEEKTVTVKLLELGGDKKPDEKQPAGEDEDE